MFIVCLLSRPEFVNTVGDGYVYY